MTNEEKARYEELDAKDCLIDDEDIIDYYSLRCEILEEENKDLKVFVDAYANARDELLIKNEQLEKENKELKEKGKELVKDVRKAIVVAKKLKEEDQDKNKAFNILNKLCTDQTDLIGKYEKVIEWLKENLNFKIEKHKSSPNCMFVSYKDLQEWLEPSNEIVDLLKEVLE